MHQPAPTSERTPPDQSGPAVPPCIAFLLSVARALLGYGRHLDKVFPDGAAQPGFPTIAAAFGTHDVRRILGHIQRGILRAMMLERFLLARAAVGRDIEPVQPPAPAEQADIADLDLKLRAPARPRAAALRVPRTDPDDPLHFEIPSLKELEAQVRRNPVGQTIAEICLDLGITPSACAGDFWASLLEAITDFGARLKQFYDAKTRRQKTYVKEREKHPDTWHWDWQTRSMEAFRQILGHLLGEPPPGAALARA